MATKTKATTEEQDNVVIDSLTLDPEGGGVTVTVENMEFVQHFFSIHLLRDETTVISTLLSFKDDESDDGLVTKVVNRPGTTMKGGHFAITAVWAAAGPPQHFKMFVTVAQEGGGKCRVGPVEGDFTLREISHVRVNLV